MKVGRLGWGHWVFGGILPFMPFWWSFVLQSEPVGAAVELFCERSGASARDSPAESLARIVVAL